MTVDIRTAAQREAERRTIEPNVEDPLPGDYHTLGWRDGFAWGAVWGAARVTPTRAQLDAVARKTLIEFTGTCVCHEAYTSRGKEDPDCVWHAVGDEFPGDLADAVLALMAGLAEGESSAQTPREPTQLP